MHPGIFRWLGVKDSIVCHSEWWKNAKLHLSPCQAAVGFAVLFLPWPLLLTLSKQLEQILFYWGSYQVRGISAAPVPGLFLSLCRVLRWHPTRAVRSREFAVSLANWILNQNRWGCGLQCVLWHFKQAGEIDIYLGRADSWLDTVKTGFAANSFNCSTTSCTVEAKLWSICPLLQLILADVLQPTPRNSWALIQWSCGKKNSTWAF